MKRQRSFGKTKDALVLPTDDRRTTKGSLRMYGIISDDQ